MKRGDQTRAGIINQTVTLLAAGGSEHVSLRRIGDHLNLAGSAVYHHFSNKDTLLEATFYQISHNLGLRRAALQPTASTQEMLIQRINFQFDQAESIVALLKYFFEHRKDFPRQSGTGYIPPEAYLHITEVIDRGNHDGDFRIADPETDAKVIAHAINGFILEYYPNVPSDSHRRDLVASIADFIWRALTNPQGSPMVFLSATDI